MISTMSLVNSSEYFQHFMKNILKSFLWMFQLVYIDDIIIYSAFLENHIRNLSLALDIIHETDLILLIEKCHFAYSSVQLLDHKMSQLELSTLKQKIKAIKKLVFSKILQQLEYDLDLFEYYHQFVHQYIKIVKLLQELKTSKFKNFSVKRKACQKFVKQDFNINFFISAKKAWNDIKNAIYHVSILIFSDFVKSFILYVDDFKKNEFDTAIHQKDRNDVKQSVMFLSRNLKDSKFRYEFTKLETAALVWIFCKISQYFDSDLFTVIMNHHILRTALQTTSVNKKQNQ